MKNILTTIISILFFGNGFTQETKKTQEIVIQTSAECGTCKKILEEKLNYTKGIRFAELDVDTKKLTVSYSEKKINAEDIRKLITETGYDADDVRANPKSQNNLPVCCQPGGMKK
jgi:mercuric ion binding protein